MSKKSKIGVHRPSRTPLSKVPRPTRMLDDDVFIKIEQAIYPATLSEEMRDRFSRQIFQYFSFGYPRPPKEAIVRRRLVSITKAAEKLHQELNENPTTVEARAQISRILKSHKAGKVSENFTTELQKQFDRFPADQHDEHRVLLRINSLVQRKCGVDLSELSETLASLCGAVSSLQKSKGGRPAFNWWHKLMLDIAGIYEEATGKPATVTENEHRAAAGERYSGAFVRVATIVDSETAAGLGIEPRRNSAIGPALQRLLKSRKPLDRKTN
jgi:hypothetical protein